MKTIAALFVSAVLALSAGTALAMNGQADRFNEARSYPEKVADAEQEKQAE